MSAVLVSLRGLVERLEAIADALPEQPTLEQLVLYVEERAEAAAVLATLDPSSLAAGEKRGLAQRLRKILDRDQALVFALFALKDDVAARLSTMPAARKTARGYGAGREGARVLRKTA